jgi:serine/threonine protein phosphatase PrpC
VKVRVGARSDIGRARVRNEDSYLVKEPLFAVADGMGGHKGGDVASSLALQTIDAAAAAPKQEDLEHLVEQIKEANHRVLERGETDKDLRGMGTTVTALLTADGKAHVVHVGDSRAYRLRDGTLQQLTEDHTLVQRMVREGKLTEEEAAHHPQRSVLTRALGVDVDIPIDQLTLDVQEGDRVLLCTDGLTSMVGRDRIQEILEGEAEPQAACERLIDAANRAGGDDNITVIVVDFVPDQGATTSGGAKTGLVSGGSQTSTAEQTDEATTATPVQRDDGAPARGRVPRRRWPIWAAVAAAVAVAGLVGARIYIDRQWYVGDADGKVAVYNGIPATVLGFKLAHVQETTDIDSAQAKRLQFWRNLEDGVTTDSFEQAQVIVARIRQDVQEASSGGAG